MFNVIDRYKLNLYCRCIDCENYQIGWTHNSSDQYNRHYCVILGGMFTPNDYCSYGEKK